MTHRKVAARWSAGSVALLAALTLGACGEDGAKDDVTNDPVDDTASVTPPTPAEEQEGSGDEGGEVDDN
ncbi:hypothetical protein JK386_08345 [Nocardioides sp. zg-536]|uniref:Uncharacterized protein n=1 Tax=Nocardioides faecalis TaxID=2803858 RepID=A0A939BVU5_9ACTN|nr:hypothetical protein [Nocardioides faecalis]MBM9459912.1 hypothetical protein [Nocardioides faecalis]MBS4753224.1 hypothetical protein [Nocardioides faecalis]QVI58858.1 hypothetical protein KG111_00130 [Nocardioides faecalis]